MTQWKPSNPVEQHPNGISTHSLDAVLQGRHVMALPARFCDLQAKGHFQEQL